MDAHCSQSDSPGSHAPASNRVRRRSCFLMLFLLGVMVSVQSTSVAVSEDGETPSGRLLLLGGGEISKEIREVFLQTAGGENARIVLIPTGSQSAASPEFIESFLEPWKKHPLRSLVVLHAQNRCQANDPDFLQPLREATGVWISGGVQSRLAERYCGTQVEAELQRLLGRDGVIAGTSAGAAVMSRVMIADGLKQPAIASGLDLFRDAIVDQHFSQRFRMTRLAKAAQIHANRFGVGIDEGTALLVYSNGGRVLGPGRVRFVVATQYPAHAVPPLMVRDYDSGEQVNLQLWREAAAIPKQVSRTENPRWQRVLTLQSRIAPSLTYSLSHEPCSLDFNR